MMGMGHLGDFGKQRLEVVVDHAVDLAHGGLEEKDDAFHVELLAEDVEEDVEALALIELGDLVCEFVGHGEGKTGVGEAADHAAEVRLHL